MIEYRDLGIKGYHSTYIEVSCQGHQDEMNEKHGIIDNFFFKTCGKHFLGHSEFDLPGKDGREMKQKIPITLKLIQEMSGIKYTFFLFRRIIVIIA